MITNSSLKVKNANGTTVFGVDGRGLIKRRWQWTCQMSGQSQATIGGNQRYQITANSRVHITLFDQ